MEEKRELLKLELKNLIYEKRNMDAMQKIENLMDSSGIIDSSYWDLELASLFHIVYAMGLQYASEGIYDDSVVYKVENCIEEIEKIRFVLKRLEWDIPIDEKIFLTTSPYIVESLVSLTILKKEKVYEKVANCYYNNGKIEWAEYLKNKYKKRNRDICFIICVNKESYYEECRSYIESLYVPKGTKVDIIPVRNATSMTSGYNIAMRKSKAKYKVYLHQDTFIINKNFIENILYLFDTDNTIGMIGLCGSPKFPQNGIWWYNDKEDCLCEIYQANLLAFSQQSYTYVKKYPYELLNCADGVLLATSVDIPWREDLFRGWHFYDISQSFEMRKRGYKVIIPACQPKWVIHEVNYYGEGMLDSCYFQDKMKFLEEYEEIIGNEYYKSPISICMIVKNEEKYLGECLKRVFPLGYEIVIVDTGSTDRTKQIALEYTDKVYDFKWCDDFAAARNFAIEKAENDFVLILDSDEITINFNKKELEKIIQENPKGIGRIVRINEFNRNGNLFKKYERVSRLFNRKYYHYEGIIHEQIIANGEKGEYYDVPLVSIHYGYDGNLETRKKKTERNIKLLEIQLKNEKEENSKNIPYTLYQLGKSYYMQEDYEKASEFFSEALYYDLNPKLDYVQDIVETYGYSLLEIKQYERAMGLLGVYEEFSVSTDFIFLCGLIYMNNGCFKEAIEEFEKATKREHFKMEGVNSYLAYYNIGVIYECCGELEKAKEYYQKCENYVLALKRLKCINK